MENEKNLLKIEIKLKDVKTKKIPVVYYRITSDITYIENENNKNNDNIRMILITKNSISSLKTDLKNIEKLLGELKSKFAKLSKEIDQLREKFENDKKLKLIECLEKYWYGEILQKDYINIYFLKHFKDILQRKFDIKEVEDKLSQIIKLIEDILELSKEIEKRIQK